MIVDFFTKALHERLFHQLSAVIISEIDLDTFNTRINASESKDRLAPSIGPSRNAPNDDVNIKVDTDNIDLKLNKLLQVKLKDGGKVSYADVVKRKTMTKGKPR